MKDVAPELLKAIKKTYEEGIAKSEILKKIESKILDGTLTYDDAHKYAAEMGIILRRAYWMNLSSDKLPDGKMYYNIAKRIIEPTMKACYEKVASISAAAQTALNQNANIGIKAIKPTVEQDQIDGILNRVANEEKFDSVKWILGEPVKVFARSAVDDTVKANAEFHYKSGLMPKVIRRTVGKTCKWCQEVAGTYTYPDVPKDVYRRHDNCDCIVEYFPGNGKRQDVWSKRWINDANSDRMRQRKVAGLNEEDDDIVRKIRKDVIPKQNIKAIVKRQEIHRKGSGLYDERAEKLKEKGQHGPSYITISDSEILELVGRYSGTGIIKYNRHGEWDNKETIITNDKIIGIVVDNRNGNSAETSVFKIHYAKDGIHIVPDYPSKKG